MKFRHLCRLAINHFTGTGVAYGLAANITAEAVGSAEWVKLTPYVDGDYWEEERGKQSKYRQLVTPAHGERLVAAFNALAAAKGENFRGLPIYAGHPDADPVRWPDERRLGGVMGVEARADGIYVKCAWNDLGQKNIAEGYLVYPSPAWPYDLKLKAQTGRIEPIELRSIGMTNMPRIAGVPAWTNSDPISDPTTTTNTDTMIKTLLLKILGLPETATDEEITAASEAFMAKAGESSTAAANSEAAVKAEKDKAVAACSERDLAKADADKFRGFAINALKTDAINTGKKTAAEWDAFAPKLAINFDEAAAELAKAKPALNTEALKLTKRGDDQTTPQGRRLAFNAAVDGHMAAGLGYDAAIDAMRGNPEQAALLAAMGT